MMGNDFASSEEHSGEHTAVCGSAEVDLLD